VLRVLKTTRDRTPAASRDPHQRDGGHGTFTITIE
jgi:hypothetical protein